MGSNTWLLAALSLLLILAGLGFRVGAFLVLAVPLTLFWWVGVVRMLGQSAPQAKVKRTLSQTRVVRGERIHVSLEVVYLGPPVDELLIADEVPSTLTVLDGECAMLAQGVPGQNFRLNYVLEAPRGHYVWQGVSLKAQFHLSARPTATSVPAQSRLLCLPQSVGASALRFQPRRTRVYAGLIPARRGGEGMEFFETREYEPGDSIRRIHWKASARTGRWITTQFEQERMADVAVILDARYKSNIHAGAQDQAPNVPLFEFGVSAALSVAETALAQSNRVGLLIYGRSLDWTLPGYGKQQKERIAHALAQANLGRKMVFEGLEYLPQKLFPKRSQIVMVSPLLPSDVEAIQRLQAQGYFVTVISPNPVELEQRLLPDTPVTRVSARLALWERRQSLTALRRAGVQMVDWHTERPLAPHLVRLLPQRAGK